MKSAQRMRNIPPSSTLSVLTLAKQLEREGKRIIHMEVGEPDFDTPAHIKRAADEALARGMTKYTPSAGIPELREAIAEHLGEGIEARNVLVTPGAKHAIFCAMVAALDPGDEVLIPSPCWTYDGTALTAGAKPVFLETRMGDGFKLGIEKVQEALTPRSRMLLLNYPNNPTGAVIDRASLRALAELASDHDMWVLSDEIYDRLVYEGKHVGLLSMPEVWERAIYINGFSKTYAMTGWRLGYAVAPAGLVAEMDKVQQATTSCVPGPVQAAGLAALRGPQESTERMREAYRGRRELIVNGLNSIGLECFKPGGAFYAFPSIGSAGIDSLKFCERLLAEAGVAAVPGSGFGPYGEGHVRFSYATSTNNIGEALGRVENFLKTF